MSLTNVLSRLVDRSAISRCRSFKPYIESLETRSVPTTFTVLTLDDSGPGSLRQAILDANDAAGADDIVFAPGLLGTISLKSGQLGITDDLTIAGPGAKAIAVSGNKASRVFAITDGATVTIAGLSILDGLATGATASGGGILNVGSRLTVANVILSNNQARGGGTGQGGAIVNASGASLAVMNSLFLENRSVGGPGNGPANGGAILSSGSSLAVHGSTFLGNLASGNNTTGGAITINMGATATIGDTTFDGNASLARDGGNGGFARGGAIYVNGATLNVADSTFTGNRAAGGSYLTGTIVQTGLAFGGAIGNADQATLFVTRSTFTNNQALGGSHNTRTGGRATLGVGTGGALFNVGLATVADSTFEQNEARGGSDNTGDSAEFQSVGSAVGGAIANSAGNTSATPALLTLSNVRLRRNRAVAGDRNTGGAVMRATGGGLSASGANPVGSSGGSTVTIRSSTIADNEAVGAQEGAGGDARGGGFANASGGVLTVSGSTVAGNRAAGRADGAGLGGGLFNDGPSEDPSNPGELARLTVLDTVITDNEAAGATGTSAGRGAGGGVFSASIFTLLSCRLAHNTARGGDGMDGADGGTGLGGSLFIGGGTASVLGTAIDRNQAVGGAGGMGGDGFGGGVYVADGVVTFSLSEITSNLALGGTGNEGGKDGHGAGGGVYNLGTFLFDGLTVIAGNRASTSDDDCFGC